MAVSRKSFGNINNNTLAEIWDNPDYIAFWNIFSARINANRELVKMWKDPATAMVYLEIAEKKYHEALAANPLPPECDTCHKSYGF